MNKKIKQLMNPKSSFVQKSIYLLGILIFVQVLLTGCGSEETPIIPTGTSIIVVSDPPQTQLVPTVGASQVPVSPTPDEEGQPAELVPEDIQYQIIAELDYYTHQVFVEENILIPHPAQVPLMEILLVVPPNDWLNVFTIQSINWQGDIPVEGYSLDRVRLTIPLEQPWLPGEIKELSIQYKLEIPIQNARAGYGPSPFGYTARQINLVDWYPMVPPYQEDGGWVVHDPWIFGEYLVYPVANFEVSLELVNSPDLVVAASSIAVQDENKLLYTLEQGRNFVFSISPDYQVLEQEVNGTTVYGYVFPPYMIPGKAAFDTTVEALTLFSEYFGPYNQSTLSMVQADFDHGMEYEGLYFQSRSFFDLYNGSEQSYLISIAAHETAHQWWYGQVANDQALEPWLDESFCTFSELLYYENLYPDSVSWWWAYRVNYYQPHGVINRSIYDFREFTNQYLEYRNATYLQGAKFLDILRSSMGEDKFSSFIKEYARSYSNQISSGDDFFSTLNNYLDPDSLTWLTEYFNE